MNAVEESKQLNHSGAVGEEMDGPLNVSGADQSPSIKRYLVIARDSYAYPRHEPVVVGCAYSIVDGQAFIRQYKSEKRFRLWYFDIERVKDEPRISVGG